MPTRPLACHGARLTLRCLDCISTRPSTMKNAVKPTAIDKARRKTETSTGRESDGASLCCRMGGLAGFLLFASGINLALGGVLADRSFALSGIKVPLSCLASAMVLAGVFLFAITRRPSVPIDF